MKTRREDLFRKIKSLLAKTVQNGCTEAEAMLALDKAKELMDEYTVTETDLAFDEPCEVNTEPKNDPDDIRSRLSMAVGAFCACRGFKNGFERIAYVGLFSETVFAHWLLDTLEEFVRRECRNWLAANPSKYRVRRLETRGFIHACSDRIAELLYQLARERHQPGTDLVVKKNALIEVTLKNAGIKLRDQFRLRWVNVAAERAGAKAGNTATFDKPVNENSEKPLALT